jgi:uncharacterized protein YjeT (DUF2065 family)
LSEQKLRIGGLIFAIIGFVVIAYIKKIQWRVLKNFY